MANKKTGGEELLQENTPAKTERSFSKAQLMSSERFRDRRDIVNALLEEEVKYAAGAVEQMIENYMKGKVK